VRGRDANTNAYAEDLARAQERANRSVSREHLTDLESRFAAIGDNFDEMMVPMENSRYYDEKMERFVGSDIEREFLTRPEDLIVASRGAWRPGMDVPEDLYAQASVTGRMLDLRERRLTTQRYLQERTMCPMAELDGAMVGLAKSLRGKSHQEKFDVLRKAVFKAVALHEVGHNVGLRHNFEGSMDALNYDKAFWDIEAAHPRNEQLKLEASQPEYKYSSIMDYHGKTNADFRGLGLYDKAAIKFGYGQLIETFADAAVSGGPALRNWRKVNDYRDLAFADDDGIGNQEPAYFADVAKMYDRKDVLFDWRKDWSPQAITALTATEVPYLFCSDEYAGWLPTCKRFDFGANQREVQEAQAVRYKNYFVFDHFLRGRMKIDWDRALGRAEAAFWDTNLTYKYMYYYRAKDPTFLATDSGADYARAVANGMNLMSEVLSMPEPERYYRCTAADDSRIYYPGYRILHDTSVDATFGEAPLGEACDMRRSTWVGLGQAYPLFIGFSEEWLNWEYTYLGTYWDKIAAMVYMAYPGAYFFRENMPEDERSYSIGMYRIYDNEMNDVFLNLIEDNTQSMASWLIESTDLLGTEADPTAEVVENSLVYGRPMLAEGSHYETQEALQPTARIAPAVARNMQMFPLQIGMIYMTSPFDDSLDFNKHAKVVLKGAPDDFLDHGSFAEVVECTFPESGHTFRAYKTSAAAGQMDVAYKLVSQCAERVTEFGLAQAAFATGSSELEDLEVGSDAYWDKRKELVELEREFDRWDFRLHNSERLLIYTRRLNQFFEGGAGY
jgi:hypothetical protein